MTCVGPGGVEQLRPGAELDAGAPEGRAAGALARVDRLPAGVLDVLDAAFREQVLQHPLARDYADAALPGVLEQQRNGLRRVLLVRPDHAGRPALDPAGTVDAGQ